MPVGLLRLGGEHEGHAVLARNPHHLLRLRLRNVARVDPRSRVAGLVDGEHDVNRFGVGLVKVLLEHHDHEVHGRVVIVVENDSKPPGRFRVDAEIIRDLSLAVSGLLNPKVGGPSFRPPLPEGVADLGYARSVKWNVSEGAEKYRRGLYIFFQRTVPYPTLLTFDCPDSNVTTGKRNRSNTPLQALTLLNNTVYSECAQHFGRRILEESGGATEQRIRTAFLLALGREPTRSEISIVQNLVEDYLQMYSNQPEQGKTLLAGLTLDDEDCAETAAWVSTARVILNLDEFMTRE